MGCAKNHDKCNCCRSAILQEKARICQNFLEHGSCIDGIKAVIERQKSACQQQRRINKDFNGRRSTMHWVTGRCMEVCSLPAAKSTPPATFRTDSKANAPTTATLMTGSVHTGLDVTSSSGKARVTWTISDYY